MKYLSFYIVGFMIGAMGFISYSAMAQVEEVLPEITEKPFINKRVDELVATSSLDFYTAYTVDVSERNTKQITDRLDKIIELLYYQIRTK